MNDWDTIEKMINTLPQWDIIKWIMGIQEELKCAKEDNLYQLRQNKNLQSKIDKAIRFIEKDILNNKAEEVDWDYDDCYFSDMPAERIKPLIDILKGEDK